MNRSKAKIIVIGTLLIGILAYSMMVEHQEPRIAESLSRHFTMTIAGETYNIAIDGISWDNGTYSSYVTAVHKDVGLVNTEFARVPNPASDRRRPILLLLRERGGQRSIAKANSLYIIKQDGTTIERPLSEIGITDAEPYRDGPVFMEKLETAVTRLLAAHESVASGEQDAQEYE